MVGSGKLGFSIAHPKRYRSFAETSDLDVAIVSPNLFDRVWEEVFRTRGTFGYWPGESDFSAYLARGWIRPDKLPPARRFQIADDWWKFFDSLAATGNFGRYKIRGGLYRDWIFLKGYQNLAVVGCKADLETPTAQPESTTVAEPEINPAKPENVAAALASEAAQPDLTAAVVSEINTREPENVAPKSEAVRPEYTAEAVPETSPYENNSNEPKT